MDLELKKGYGERIRQVRKSNGNMSQTDFGKAIFVGQDYISGIEHEKKVPHPRTLELICSLFGISKEWLYLGEGVMYDDVTKNIIVDDTKLKNVFTKIMDLNERDLTLIEGLIDNMLLHNE